MEPPRRYFASLSLSAVKNTLEKHFRTFKQIIDDKCLKQGITRFFTRDRSKSMAAIKFLI